MKRRWETKTGIPSQPYAHYQIQAGLPGTQNSLPLEDAQLSGSTGHGWQAVHSSLPHPKCECESHARGEGNFDSFLCHSALTQSLLAIDWGQGASWKQLHQNKPSVCGLALHRGRQAVRSSLRQEWQGLRKSRMWCSHSVTWLLWCAISLLAIL